MGKPIKTSVVFDADKMKVGMPVRIKRQNFLFVGVVVHINSETVASFAGAKMELVNGVFTYRENVTIDFRADENFDKLKVED